MCTAATYKTKDFYFGRTLDYEFSYGDEITVTPRNYPFHFRHSDKAPDSHYDRSEFRWKCSLCRTSIGQRKRSPVRIHPMDSQPVCHLKRSPPETLNYESHQHTVQ